MAAKVQKISFIGFGEAGQAFARGILEEYPTLQLKAFDIKADGPDADSKIAEYDFYGVADAGTAEGACSDADLIFSLVTAEQAENAAIAASKSHLNGTYFLDCNSCAPNTKRRSATHIGQAGGVYVDVAVMAPVHPKLHKVPCLVAGPEAKAISLLMQSLGMNVEIAGEEIGVASMRKMIRSVMIKGLEALTLECFLAARKAGVDFETMASLEASFPGFGWSERAPYMMERAASHGMRRAAEMAEVVKTLEELGLSAQMTRSTVVRQREMGELGLDISAQDAKTLASISDIILAQLGPDNMSDVREE